MADISWAACFPFYWQKHTLCDFCIAVRYLWKVVARRKKEIGDLDQFSVSKHLKTALEPCHHNRKSRGIVFREIQVQGTSFQTKGSQSMPPIKGRCQNKFSPTFFFPNYHLVTLTLCLHIQNVRPSHRTSRGPLTNDNSLCLRRCASGQWLLPPEPPAPSPPARPLKAPLSSNGSLLCSSVVALSSTLFSVVRRRRPPDRPHVLYIFRRHGQHSFLGSLVLMLYISKYPTPQWEKKLQRNRARAMVKYLRYVS
ncbi:hypothetical protein K438DRAFT_1103808 [Mycena galopus ATCC 62051]|nr:hypothetical protein K438DRAFT_1103808 [Mycena galopus ATCC 62051]